jgi:hypothetical protein
MERFPALELIVRFGNIGSVLIAICAACFTSILLLPIIGWWGFAASVVVGALLFLVCKSYVEIITILCDMLVPR